MEQRLQITADDAVLEITETHPVKRRLSEKALMQRKEYLAQSIGHFQGSLAEVEADLALLNSAKDERGKK